jgi:[ribosomal protein S5]-alanine N-acetyltransferase
MVELRVIHKDEKGTDLLFLSPEGRQLIDSYATFYEKVGFALPWVGYAVVRDGQLVGTGGFTGQPFENKVEIAYWSFAAYEGQGIATHTCRSLIEIALRELPTVIITAKTAPEVNASVKILKNNGFIFKGIVQDHEIGDAWLWELAQEKRR